MEEIQTKPFVDLIWNISLICPWDCKFCCVDAVQVKRDSNHIVLREQSLARTEKVILDKHTSDPSLFPHLQRAGVSPSIFDIGLRSRQQRGLELDFETKLEVLHNLSSFDAKIDFAGGDPFVCYENYLVMVEASRLFGRSRIAVTTTGVSIDPKRYDFDSVCEIVGQFEFTLDEPPQSSAMNRPRGYNSSNLRLAQKFSDKGVRTKAQMPMHRGNTTESTIDSIYNALNLAGIDDLLLMRTFPVGRGASDYDLNWEMTAEEYMNAISQFKRLETLNGKPRIKLQCALKGLNHEHSVNPCDMIRESFGVNPQGLLLSSIWATSPNGSPLDDVFVIGDLSNNRMEKLLASPSLIDMRNRLDENFGHCKIFAFLNSTSKGSDRLFERSDPLFSEQ